MAYPLPEGPLLGMPHGQGREEKTNLLPTLSRENDPGKVQNGKKGKTNKIIYLMLLLLP